ncbi:MAG TPA: DUF1810 domain-containing protein [Sphingomicrobium sp.]|nr:DUF1810 domain-containing protein [Sphingomicrobium sp.]
MSAWVRDPFHLQRFIEAQERVYDAALSELSAGSKQSHWMWFIFPQLAGLGRSFEASFFAIRSIDEARAYLRHPVLGPRLRDCVQAILPWAGLRTPEQILGEVDARKLRSCLTLFDHVETSSLFEQALMVFFDDRDQSTLALLNAPE